MRVPPGRVSEVARFFTRFGFTAFGGPAAHIAMLRDEVVRRRQWITDQHFLDLLGATNLIPGPNSTEMVIHVGYVRAGWRGLIVAGLSFTLPATLIVLALAWVYVQYGALPELTGILYGVKPVIIGVIAQALVGLAKNAIKDRWMFILGLGVLGLSLLGVSELILLLAAGLIALILRRVQHTRLNGWPLWLGLPAAVAAVPFNLGTLFLVFLKTGAILYGTGYVLIAFLRADLVLRLGWLTDQQLLDAIAIGQVTPGPLFTAATFIGYILGGVPGALIATAGIFLPAFIFVALSNPFIPRLRQSPTASALLDGVNAASLGLMAAVTLQIAQAALIDPITLVLALAAAGLLVRFKINSMWLVLGGAAVGLLVTALR